MSRSPVLRKSFRYLPILFSFVLSISSVSARPTALVDSRSLWNDPRLQVCFATSATRINPKADIASDVRRARVIRDHSPFEARIRMLLEREYTPERTGLSFQGFGNCDRVPNDEPSAPAFIYADTDLSDFGITSIGDESRLLPVPARRGLISGTVLNLRMVKTNKDYSVARAAKALAKITAADPATVARIYALAADIDAELAENLQDVTVIHEMGHLAGLLHEERRRDMKANQPPWCRSADDRRNQDPTDEKTYGTEFDPFSVMNYCTDDVAKGFAFYHLFCEFPRVAEALAAKNAKFAWLKMKPSCDFMMRHRYPARLSARDRASLRRAYLGVPVPAGSRSYRTNPDEVRVLKALGALYEALPDSMELGTKAGLPLPRR